jgi:hypothetical protein
LKDTKLSAPKVFVTTAFQEATSSKTATSSRISFVASKDVDQGTTIFFIGPIKRQLFQRSKSSWHPSNASLLQQDSTQDSTSNRRLTFVSPEETSKFEVKAFTPEKFRWGEFATRFYFENFTRVKFWWGGDPEGCKFELHFHPPPSKFEQIHTLSHQKFSKW